MKTILFISPTGTLDNGAEIAIFNLMKYLVSIGHRVYNIAPIMHDNRQKKYQTKCQEAGIIPYFIPTLKWWWEDAPGDLPGTENERTYYYRDNIQRIRTVIREDEIDLVITNTVNIFQGAVAAACESTPHFWLIHEFPEDEFVYYMDKIDFIDDYADEIYCVTGTLQQKLATIFNQRQIKQFVPYSEIAIRTLKKGKRTRIVSVGRLTERKNQFELVQAFEKLNRSDLELVFIGGWDKSYKQKLDQYIVQNNIKNVSFKGHVEDPWAEVTDLDLCVFTSKMETFGLVYVESLLNGIPVIISDNFGHLSAYEIFKSGQLYSQGDIEQLSMTINQSIKDFVELKKIAIAFVPTAINYYSVAESYKQLIEEINSTLESKDKSIRHLKVLLSHNEQKSKLAKLESRVRGKINRMTKRFMN
ncbi:MAG: glycosyltransferase family 4 protein [Streptococcaceae bacterium]|nr:glycosyltransferase family 4 protein [Streptococcaceae bacterium]MCH4176011.1 glycosyltransferase family 4 protein [Streptococcaceae bacterium]